jgi:hypothetical protein
MFGRTPVSPRERFSGLSGAAMATIGKSNTELTHLANEALRDQPGCETAQVVTIATRPHASAGRNWEIPNVVLGDSLISDVDRAIITVHHRLGRRFHLVGDR